MRFHFLFSPIFENRTIIPHTSILKKNSFLGILKSKKIPAYITIILLLPKTTEKPIADIIEERETNKN